MEIFLVNIEYNVSHYMGGDTFYAKTHLVHAETEDEAMEKHQHFMNQKLVSMMFIIQSITFLLMKQ